MSSGYELAGRTRQKQRTREAVVRAARDLVAEGITPTVELAAEHAGVSRTTAYRYFADQAALIAAAHPEITTVTLLPDEPPSDVRERIEAAVRRFTELVVETEAQQRTMLRLSLDPAREGSRELLLRQGRAIAWLEDALSPLVPELGAPAVHALAIAIRSVTGIETYVWLVDVAGMRPKDAVEVMRWTAQAQLEAVLAGVSPPRPSARSGAVGGKAVTGRPE